MNNLWLKFKTKSRQFKTLLILTTIAVIVVVIFALRSIFPSNKVKDALYSYHEGIIRSNGQSVLSIKIENLNYRLVNESTPDTLIWVENKNLGSKYYDNAIAWLSVSNKEKSRHLRDSALLFYAAADAISAKLKQNGPGKPIFTRCTYLLTVKTDSEQYSAPKSVILNEKLSVVWPMPIAR